MHVTRKILGNKDKAYVTLQMLMQVIQYKQEKRRWPSWDPHLTNLTNGTARCSLKNIK